MQIMLCQVNGRWETALLQRPFGRGINFQMSVSKLDLIVSALIGARWPLYEEMHEVSYRVGERRIRRREVLVQDPDGYLVRVAEDLDV